MTADLDSGPRSVFGRLVESIRRIKAGYDAEDRYSKMRIWIVGALGADVLVTLIFVLIASSTNLPVTAWYEEAFPSNLIVLRNEGPAIADVEVVVDGKYTARITSLASGVAGLELDREFKDGLDFPPPASYRPKLVEIRALGSTRKMELRKK
jgi:hypothetical protein